MNQSQKAGRSRRNKTQTDPAADATTVPPHSEQDTIPPRSAAPNTAGKEAMPERFGRYRIVTELGHGGMGSVYLAEDTELHRQVALKIPKFAQQDDPEMLERFYREARSAATLNHPNICQVHDIGEYQGAPYISMAYIGGPPLSKLVGTPRLRSERTIAKLARKIAVGLAAAQNKGILHRDLKPGNILLDERNEPVITDFGLARQVEQNVDDRLTQEGMLIGTPAYMSPEQISGDLKRVGPASDVYSLGVVLYELLTGELPYKGPITSVIGQIVQGKPVPPAKLRPGLDKRLEAICLKMMAASVDNRYPDALEVVAALGHYLDETAQEAGFSVVKVAGPQATLEGHKQHILGLLTQGQFPEAMERLERLAAVQVAGGAEYAQWAHAEFTRLKAMPAPVREKGPTLVAEAIKMLAQQNFAEIIELLGNVPPEYRTTEASQLLKQAQELAAEAGQLNERMQRAVRDRQYDDLRENVLERLLELEPGNLQARDIYERLGTYGPGKKLRFDKAGNLLPAYSGSWWMDQLARLLYERLTRRKYQPRRRSGSRDASLPTSAEPGSPDLPLVPIGIGLGILGVVGLLLGIVFVFRQGMETVRVELDPAVANDTTVTVWLDGKQMEIAGVGETIKLKPGEHGYELRRGDEVIRTDEFRVVKDRQTVLRISIDQTPDPELAQSTDDESTNSPDLRDSAESKVTSEPPAASALEESEVGEVALFNGRDLEGWQPVPQDSSGDWVIEDGTIVCNSDKSPILWTDRPYGNFHLKLEYKVDANADGGIYLRSHSRQYGVYMGAMEVPLRGDESTAGDDDTGRNGGIYKLVAPAGNAFRPGQWNEIEIRAESSDLTVILNGNEVVRTNLASQLAENPEKPFLSNALGYVGLQCFGGSGVTGTVRYRNIRLRELDQQPDFESEPLEVRRFEGHDVLSSRVAVSPDGRLVASSPPRLLDEKSNQQHAVRVWDLATGSQSKQLDGQVGMVMCLRFAPDSRTLLCVLHDKILRWDIESGRVDSAEVPRTIYVAAVSDDGLKIASSTRDGRVCLLDATTGHEIHAFGRKLRAADMEFIPGSQRFVATSAGTIAVLDPEADTVIDLPKDHKDDGVHSVAVSPDGTRALSGGGYPSRSQDYAIRYWDLQTRQVIRTLQGHSGQVGRICFGPDGRYALSSERGRTAKTILWDVKTGEKIGRIRCLPWGAHFTPHGQHALLPHRDNIVRLWRLPLPATSSETMVPQPTRATDAVQVEPHHSASSRRRKAKKDVQWKDGAQVEPRQPLEPPRYLAIWVKNVPPVDWKAAHDLNDDDFQQTSAKYDGLGYAPICISGYAGKEDQNLFAGVWIKKPRTIEVMASHSLEPSEFREQVDDLRRRRFRPVWLDVYGKGADWRYATVWIRDNSNIVWRIETCDVKPGDRAADEAKQASWDSLIATGSFPRVSSAHIDGNGVFHQTQIWHKESVSHSVWFGDFNFYQTKLDEYKSGDQGPIYVDSYGFGSAVSFTLIGNASAGVKWTRTASVNAAEFQKDFDRLSNEGYRPTVISAR